MKEFKKEIRRIENEIDKVCNAVKFDEDNQKKFDGLSNKLWELDPYNDMFHLACPEWPNCEEVGCQVTTCNGVGMLL